MKKKRHAKPAKQLEASNVSYQIAVADLSARQREAADWLAARGYPVVILWPDGTARLSLHPVVIEAMVRRIRSIETR